MERQGCCYVETFELYNARIAYFFRPWYKDPEVDECGEAR